MTIEERYLLVGLPTFILYQMFKPLGWLRNKPRWVIAIFSPYILLFLALDVLYNVVFGSILFLELPRELLFTDRLIRHKPKIVAKRLCELLNAFDPGHC